MPRETSYIHQLKIHSYIHKYGVKYNSTTKLYNCET